MRLTPEQAAVRLGVTRQTVYNWIKTNQIKHIKIGGRYRIEETTVLEMVNPHNDANPLTGD